MPCRQFEANALYFLLCVTAYNLFVLFRHSLPPEWHTRRAITVRWRLYALAAKVVCHARRVFLKFRPDQARLVKSLLAALAPPARRSPARFRIPVTPGRRGTARVTGPAPSTCPPLPPASTGTGQVLPCQGRS